MGSSLAVELEKLLQSRQTVCGLRGTSEGTFMAWDFASPTLRDKFLVKMRKNGVLMGGCGSQSVRLRPMLTFGEKHQAILLGAIDTSLGEL